MVQDYTEQCRVGNRRSRPSVCLTCHVSRLFSCRMGTPAPDSAKRLVEHFDQDLKVFLSGDCEEEQLSKAKPPHDLESAKLWSLSVSDLTEIQRSLKELTE